MDKDYLEHVLLGTFLDNGEKTKRRNELAAVGYKSAEMEIISTL